MLMQFWSRISRMFLYMFLLIILTLKNVYSINFFFLLIFTIPASSNILLFVLPLVYFMTFNFSQIFLCLSYLKLFFLPVLLLPMFLRYFRLFCHPFNFFAISTIVFKSHYNLIIFLFHFKAISLWPKTIFKSLKLRKIPASIQLLWRDSWLCFTAYQCL